MLYEEEEASIVYEDAVRGGRGEYCIGGCCARRKRRVLYIRGGGECCIGGCCTRRRRVLYRRML
jgi:hypothetical protein